MSEISKYESYKKKLEGVCEENNLTFRFRHDVYPITLTIRPVTSLEGQMSMLEDVENNGYTNQNAYIQFVMKDGDVSYITSETFTISDTLFSKIKNLFKKLHYFWVQYFFRDVIERGVLCRGSMPVIDEDEADDHPEDDELEGFDFDNEDETEEDSKEIQEAAAIVRAENKATVQLIQRRMKVGPVRAAHIIEQLEELGIVGPYNGSEPREVLPYDEPEDASWPSDESGR